MMLKPQVTRKLRFSKEPRGLRRESTLLYLRNAAGEDANSPSNLYVRNKILHLNHLLLTPSNLSEILLNSFFLLPAAALR